MTEQQDMGLSKTISKSKRRNMSISSSRNNGGDKQIEAIALTRGIDGVFIGPADLSASMVTWEINHPKVVK